MLKKFLSIAVMSGLFSSGALAEDLLAQITNGAVSDTSKGVRLLSAEEEKQVVGGYEVRFASVGNNEIWAYADYGTRGETSFVANHYAASIYGENNPNISTFRGLCGIDMQTCSDPSRKRMADFLNVTYGDYFDFRPAYIVKRNIGTSRTGSYVYFTYSTGAVDVTRGQVYKFDTTTSSIHIKSNMIIKEIQNKYKSSMESALGGWSVR